MAPFEPIKTANAPAGLSDVVGPRDMSKSALTAQYSQAVRAGNTIYLSGSIPRDMDGNIVQGTVQDRARQVIKVGHALILRLVFRAEGRISKACCRARVSRCRTSSKRTST